MALLTRLGPRQGAKPFFVRGWLKSRQSQQAALGLPASGKRLCYQRFCKKPVGHVLLMPRKPLSEAGIDLLLVCGDGDLVDSLCVRGHAD